MMENLLEKSLGKQFLITAHLEQKLQVVNFIKEGYDSNKPILINNRFLHFTAHIYYRSIIIDLFALFGPANKNNSNSFRFIETKYYDLIKTGYVEVVLDWISKVEKDIEIIKELRHQQIAHYDFEKVEAIKLNFNNHERIITLSDLSKKIILFLGKSFKDSKRCISYDFERRHQIIDSLERLIAKATAE